MLAYDPTSAAHSLAAAPNRGWTVEEVAHMQAQDVAARAPADGGDSIGVPAPPAAAASGGALADVMQRATVSGRYRGAASSELELRVDVDGVRPTRRVSGDFFRRTGGTLSYVGSFVVSTPNITVSPTEVVIEGEGVFTFPSGSPRLRVTIPRVSALAPRPAAAAQFLTPTGIPGTAFTCAYESAFFRTVEFEQDSVQVPPSAGAPVDPFESYDTGRLAPGGPARVLTVAAAYAEAGIEIVETGGGAPIEFTLAGPDRIWTDSELHAAMVGRFSRYTPDVAWRVWLLAATRHEDPGLRGVMFDSARRQGCAVFHDVIGGGDDRSRRAMLRTYMHELGHCFNLYHSHEKSLMVPPQPNRLDALSWMQYPDYYTASSAAGALAYWRAFPFQFDDEELTHLRHGFRSAVVPGANAFGRRAADVDPDTFADTIADESGLAFELRAPERFLLGTPVVVELKLSATDLRGRTVNRRLHPNFGFVQIGIRQLGGSTVPYRPLIVHCAEPDLVTLDAANGAVYDSAYIGFGKDGFYFDNPGQYELRAL